MLAPMDPERPGLPAGCDPEQVEINLKYDGYITTPETGRTVQEDWKKRKFRKIWITMQLNSLRIEAVQKLKEYRPVSIGQASRISGVSPADISVLLVYLSGNHR